MSYHIFERWPFTSFQNLNLDWLMKAVKEAVTTAEEAAGSVDQFDARITANTNAIQLLQTQVGAIQGVFNISVNSNQVASSEGSPITGSQIYNKMMQDKQLPYLFYQGECYAVEKWTTAGDMRFYTIHATEIGDAVMRRILVPAQSSNCAYSIVNLSGSGSSDAFTVIITDRGEDADPEYVSDTTFNAIRSQMDAGRTPVFLIKTLASGGDYYYEACGDVVATSSYIDVYDAFTDTRVSKWRINPNNSISRYNNVYHLATLDNVESMAVVTYPQTLTAAEQAQARENIGAAGVQIVWGYQDEDQGTSVIRRKSDDSIYTSAQMFADQSAGRTILIESPNGIYYLSSAGSYFASFFNGGTHLMTVTTSGSFTEIAIPSAAVPVVTNTDSIVQTTINPNTFYIFPNASQLSINLAAGTTGIVNEYHFRFASGSTATQLDLPATVEIPDDFNVAANTVYEISIIDNYMVYSSWAVSA